MFIFQYKQSYKEGTITHLNDKVKLWITVNFPQLNN